MVGDKRPYRSNGDIPCCLTGEAPSHFSPSKKQATGRDTFRVAATIETDAHRLETRLKQCQYGKNTIGYDNYIAAVPKNKRRSNVEEHPRTPDPYEIQSKRAYEGRIKVWRRALHLWDTKGQRDSVSLNPAAEASNIESIISSAQSSGKADNDGHTRSSSTRVSCSSNSNDSATDRRSSQPKRDTGKENNVESGIRSDNSGKRRDNCRAGRDDTGHGDNSSANRNSPNDNGGVSIDRDNKLETYRVDKKGSPKSADGTFGTFGFLCSTEPKHERSINEQLPAVKVENHSSSEIRLTESPLKTEMDVTRDCERSNSIVQGMTSTLSDKKPAAFTVSFSRATATPAYHEQPLHSPDKPKPSRKTGIFDDEDGPTVIFDEDSMQSVDYERSMLNQQFNSDTVDVLETVDEDEEDVL